jgi:hypothetical protein
VSDRIAPRWLLSIHRRQEKWEEIKYAKYLPPLAFGAFVLVYVCELFEDKSSVCSRSELPHFFGQWEEVYKCRR